MQWSDVMALLPLLAVTGVGILALLTIAIRRSYQLVFGLTVTGLLVSLAGCFLSGRVAPIQVTPLLIIDGCGVFFLGLLAAVTLIITLLSYQYWRRDDHGREEFYVLLLFGTLGGMVLVTSAHFATFFLGLELLSSAIYLLAAYDRQRVIGTEAAIKYLILAGVSSAFLLFGMALVYADTGTMQLATLAPAFSTGSVLLLAGAGLMLVGVSFKLALFPFFLWAPDVYQGAPSVVTAFISTVSKGAIFVVFLRFFSQLQTSSFFLLLSVLAITSMIAGNFLALRQANLKRLIAYSSVANFGYLLVAFIASGVLGLLTIAFYLTTYFLAVLGVLGVITVLSGPRHERDEIAEYRGLAWRRPWLAALLTISLLSLAGLPLTAGFIGKFLLVTSGVGARLWGLLIILVLNSGASLFYYLRVVHVLFRHPDEHPRATALPVVSYTGSLALILLAIPLVWLGVYPTPIIRLIEWLLTGVAL